MSLLYDGLRSIRRVFRCNNFMVACMDLFFWGYTGCRCFYIMHTYSNGTLRWFAILGTIFVITMYMLFVSKYVLSVEVYVLLLIRKVLVWIKKCLTKFLKLTIIISTGKKAKKGTLDGKTGSIPDKVS